MLLCTRTTLVEHIVHIDGVTGSSPVSTTTSSATLRIFSGALAQLVARLNGIQKVRGSTPLCSTIKMRHPLWMSYFYVMKAWGVEPGDVVNEAPVGPQSAPDRAPPGRERRLPYAPP